MYEYGKGIEQDYEKAVQWYKKAAEKGYARAEYNLGVMFEHGKGVEQDYEKAVQWYMKAEEKGYASAYNGLAWTLHLMSEYEEALPWAEQAYKEFRQDTNVIDTLATVYQGLGRTEEALEMFELCLKIKEEQQMDDESLNETKDKIEKIKEIQQKGQV
jgi:TPR repeat protein